LDEWSKTAASVDWTVGRKSRLTADWGREVTRAEEGRETWAEEGRWRVWTEPLDGATRALFGGGEDDWT